jgi:D-methionine transport system permease protein
MRCPAWLALLLALSLVGGCDEKRPGPVGDAADKTVKFIMSDAAFNSEVVPILKQEMARQGFTLDWVVVNDIIQPNKMVDSGAADANSFQHEPYFDQFVTDHQLTNIKRGFYTVYTASGLYSKRYTSLSQVPDGAIVAIPVDPANNGRALFLLRDQGLLTLRPGVDVTHASQRDIIDNPHRFQFKEVDQMMLQRAFEDVDIGFLFSAYAQKLGFAAKDALALETVDDSPYKGIVAVRADLLGTPKIKALENAYESQAIKDYFRHRYGDAIVFLDRFNQAAVPTKAAVPAGSGSPDFGFAGLFEDVAHAWPDLVQAIWQTLYMLVLTIPMAVLLGTPLGTLLFLTRPGSFIKAPRAYFLLNGAVNLVRSFPFLILMIAMIPVTRLLVGTALGTTAATVPMIVYFVPYFARFVEQTLLDVNRGVIEAAQSMGASRLQIVWKVLYTEARSGIASSVTILTVSFLSYSTVAGLVGGGGIGDFAIRYGYYRYQTGVMFFTIFLTVAFVQAFQFAGNIIVRRLDKRI